MKLPTTNAEYPILTVDPTAQNTFFDSAPLVSIIDESVPVMTVVVVWNIHVFWGAFLPSSVTYDS